jgi:hypothetical protein
MPYIMHLTINRKELLIFWCVSGGFSVFYICMKRTARRISHESQFAATFLLHLLVCKPWKSHFRPCDWRSYPRQLVCLVAFLCLPASGDNSVQHQQSTTQRTCAHYRNTYFWQNKCKSRLSVSRQTDVTPWNLENSASPARSCQSMLGSHSQKLSSTWPFWRRLRHKLLDRGRFGVARVPGTGQCCARGKSFRINWNHSSHCASRVCHARQIVTCVIRSRSTATPPYDCILQLSCSNTANDIMYLLHELFRSAAVYELKEEEFSRTHVICCRKSLVNHSTRVL